MDVELQDTWAEQLRRCCDLLAQGEPDPAIVVQVTGRLRGTPGRAVAILHLVKRLAREQGLLHQASLVNRELSVRLRVGQARRRCHVTSE